MSETSSKVNPAKNRPAELRAAAHKRAKTAAVLSGKNVVDLISLGADKVSRPILRRHGLNDLCEPVASNQVTKSPSHQVTK